MCAAAGGGGKKPALISSILQWLMKYVGGSIPFDDKVDPRLDSPELVGVNVLSFDSATSQFCEFEEYAIINGDLLEFTTKALSASSEIIFGGTGNRTFIRFTSPTQMQVNLTSGSAGAVFTIPNSQAFSRYGIQFDFDNLETSLYINGVFSEKIAVADYDAADIRYLARNATTYGSVVLSDVSISNSSVTKRRYPLEEGIGLSFDVSGNGKHLSSNSGVWDTADGVDSYNMTFGGRFAWQLDLADVPTGNEIVDLNYMPV